MKKLYYNKNSNNNYCIGLHINVEVSHADNTKSWWQGKEYYYKLYRDMYDEGIWHMPNTALIKAVGLKLSISMNISALNIAKEKDNVK